MDSPRKSKHTLLPPVTISNFDDSERSSSSSETLETQKLLRRIPNEMFLVSLLEELCACYVKDNRQQRILFKIFSGYLSKAKMIPVTSTQDEFQQVRTTYRMAIRKFLDTALTASQADPQERYLSLPATGVGEQIRKAFLVNPGPVFFPPFLNPFKKQMPQVMSRYKKDFVELERIGKGGFGRVYRVIREVKLLARMQHPNIVRYNTAWIDHQPSQTSPRNNLPAIEYRRQESSSSDDIENDGYSPPHSSGVVSNTRKIETSCIIIKDVTDELLEEDCEFHSDPTIEEEIDEGDVEITFESGDSQGINGVNDNPGYVHSHATISSKQCTSISNSESFHLTRKENEISIDFNASYTGNHMHSYHELKSKVTTSSVTTEEIISSKETEGINLCGDFGSFDPLRSKKEDYHEQVKSRDHALPQIGAISNGIGIKTMDYHSISSTACLGARKEEQERTYRDHDEPSEFEKSKVILYIQMELCSRTLSDWLEERNEWDPIPGCDYFSIVDDSVNQAVFKQMVEGIGYIHQKNLLHRDLKPKNIFLAGTEKEFHVCIGDFGLAREHSAEKQQDPVTPLATLKHQLYEVVIPAGKLTTDIGTSTYASPEQLYGNMYDHKSDMYSLGMMYFEMYHPFKSHMERSKCLTALREGTVPDDIRTRWPDEFTIIEQLTSKDPDRRPSADELKKGKLFMPNDEVIKSLKKDIMKKNQQLKEKDDVIKSLQLELKRFRALQRS